MRGSKLTRQMIDYVCDKTDRFKDKERTRAICEMRMNGATFEEIGKAFNLSKDRCGVICNRVERIYEYLLKRGEVIQVVTNFDRLKAMSVDELASFLADFASRNIIDMADSYICRKCKRGNGGRCPADKGKEDWDCIHDADNTATVKQWLEGEVE